MTSRDFCYWLQGFIELTPKGRLDAQQMESVRKHLAMVFKHEIDPSMGAPEKQIALDAIHQGPAFDPGGNAAPGGGLYRC